MLKIYNTLTRKKEEFKPINDGKVTMYVCGPTVYNYIHIGNARPIIVFDTVRRYLESKGYEVIYVQNFTDVDDKIINKAKELNVPENQISEKYIEQYFQDANDLKVRKATFHPKVTENMDEIISFINGLVEQGAAYKVNGDVFFKTENFEEYGQLSRQSIKDLFAGARIEVDNKKDNPLDFALWKSAKNDEIAWKSPWGEGRPGWHIECSTMARKYLGETIDIHAGGADLIFPHHENEIAQSESLSHKKFANYWMHNGYITIDNEKMSKSLGNVFTVRDLLQKYDANILRYLVLSVHYRSPINFSTVLINSVENSIERIKTAYFNLEYQKNNIKTYKEVDLDSQFILDNFSLSFEKEMDDDFNTANAIAVIFDLIKYSNKYMQQDNKNKKYIELLIELLDKWLNILGLEDIIINENKNDDDNIIEQLIMERTEAKENKDWVKADAIREQLNQLGILIEDTPEGVRWRRK